MNTVSIAGRVVGAGRPCFLIAEIGLNHNGDMDLALRSIDAAARAGADAVKFQNYRTEDFIADRSLTYTYRFNGRPVRERQYDMFKRCELDGGDLKTLRRRADRRGVVFLSTPTSERTLRDVVSAGAPVLKNGSDFLGNLPLIRAMGRTGLPTILSTGMAVEQEIREAVEAFQDTGNKGLILLHCTSSYPTRPSDAHMRKIGTLAATFGCPVGFSDHTVGTTAAVVATALGACCIEKHFTVDRNLPGPDHALSSDPEEFSRLRSAVREAERCLGRPKLGPTSGEAKSRAQFRLSCVAARALPKGRILSSADIIFRRPGTGFRPALVDRLIGRRLARPVRMGRVFAEGDIS